MQAEAFLLKYLRQSFNSTLNSRSKYMDFHRKSESSNRKMCFHSYPDTELKIGKNIFTVEKGFNIEMKTCKFLSGYSSNVHMMTKNNTLSVMQT